MGDLRSFSKTMKLIGANVSTNADVLVRKVALAVDSTVVLATPVDTGQARSNWVVDVGDAPNESDPSPPYSPGKGGSTAQANSTAAIDQGKTAIARYVGGRGESIWIENNLDYINELNEGKSDQAPAGFVEEAVLDGVATAGAGKLISVTDTQGNAL